MPPRTLMPRFVTSRVTWSCTFRAIVYICLKLSPAAELEIFYLSDKPPNGQSLLISHPFNAPIHVVAKILKMVTNSTMETGVAATFYNCKEGLPFRVILEEMDHPQPPTLVEVGNEAAIVFLLGTMKMKHSKKIDMRLYCVKNRISQQHFPIYWRPRKKKVGDYVSKHHSTVHHQKMPSNVFANLTLIFSLPTSTETCLQKVCFCLQQGGKLDISNI